MNCSDFDEFMVSFLYGDIDTPEEAALQTHLGSCSACLEKLKTRTKTKRLLDELSSSDVLERTPASKQATHGLTKLESPIRPQRHIRRSLKWPIVAAASLLVGVSAITFWAINLRIAITQDRLTLAWGRHEIHRDAGSDEGLPHHHHHQDIEASDFALLADHAETFENTMTEWLTSELTLQKLERNERLERIEQDIRLLLTTVAE